MDASSAIREGTPQAGGGAPPRAAGEPGHASQPSASSPLLWPLVAAVTASDAAAAYFHEFALAFIGDVGRGERPEPSWTTPNRVVLDLATMRLRDFSLRSEGVPTLVCAPFALHGATIADLAPGHSLVEALGKAGLNRVFVTDWRSASPDMGFLSIDNYLADLNVALDEIGTPVNLIGLCQGGWMALVYAARFPRKVRRLVLAGAPIDIDAGGSVLSGLAEAPLSTFAEIVRLGEGRVLGQRVLELWGPALGIEQAAEVLQLAPDIGVAESRELEGRFREWYAWTVDLPGTYYLQVVSWLFKENRIAQGRFVALGRVIDLADVGIPVFLIAGRDDTLVSVAQLLATARLIGTAPHAIETVVEPCGHLSLFTGKQTLDRAWGRAASWLCDDLPAGRM